MKSPIKNALKRAISGAPPAVNDFQRNARKADNTKMPEVKAKPGGKPSGRVISPDLAASIRGMNKGGKGRA